MAAKDAANFKERLPVGMKDKAMQGEASAACHPRAEQGMVSLQPEGTPKVPESHGVVDLRDRPGRNLISACLPPLPWGRSSCEDVETKEDPNVDKGARHV
ncbi:hypothetical protein [Jiella marina]|uniref:hypothetical protein n=1 Tax=Jiella sp. LLJ827 TaxID=2917712 RepID=UPI0021010F53|nr:hypothetical protein [Jiella sp. LLJ827]MCQ0987731.1 hypothetical protein [Jiella sp. LLJ827]